VEKKDHCWMSGAIVFMVFPLCHCEEQRFFLSLRV
jgi:hypothetical protein